MSYIPTLDEAHKLIEEHNKEPFHVQHAEIVSGVVGWFAEKLDPENRDFWAAVGMLHDLDFEEYPQEHCTKCEEMMNNLGMDQKLIRAVCSHGWGMTKSKYEPEHIMEKVLFAVDELTGLIGAAAMMRPSKSPDDMELKSLKKKFKDKKFAAGCSRDVIQEGADRLGWTLDELLEQTLEAMKSLHLTF